jgi:CheY-like chemotaxis protein
MFPLDPTPPSPVAVLPTALPIDGFPLSAAPPDRPLMGLTVLLVEDSRLASEGMRLLCLRSGARLRRADTLHAAERHLRTYRPGVAIVDLGLPDGSGLGLIRRLSTARPRIDAIIATSGDDSLEAEALAAGAALFIPKPILGLAAFQAAILSALPPGRGPKGPRPLPVGEVDPDPIALRDDLCHAAEILSRGGGPGLDYVAQFLAGVAKGVGDEGLMAGAGALGAARASGREGLGEAEGLAATLLDRLALAPAF